LEFVSIEMFRSSENLPYIVLRVLLYKTEIVLRLNVWSLCVLGLKNKVKSHSCLVLLNLSNRLQTYRN